MTDSYDAQAELLSALKANEKLTSLVAGGFHNLVAKQKADFPRVVYTEIRNSDEGFADNEVKKSIVNFQISIFCDEATIHKQTQITKIVAKIMHELQYKKYDSHDLYEEDTKLYHRGLRFTKNFHNN
ncbi:hypothetical protein ACA30_05865 [Virgibacillus soli]|nr:hypothetical protein ACA30_05865 [Virgibacillus soli]